uniref:Uncharacterized protein n=1 Tax=Micrurus lemniscatus lemniscatus TaxID=129467 RepID=A0A2D4I0I9_MICLE
MPTLLMLAFPPSSLLSLDWGGLSLPPPPPSRSCFGLIICLGSSILCAIDLIGKLKCQMGRGKETTVRMGDSLSRPHPDLEGPNCPLVWAVENLFSLRVLGERVSGGRARDPYLLGEREKKDGRINRIAVKGRGEMCELACLGLWERKALHRRRG